MHRRTPLKAAAAAALLVASVPAALLLVLSDIVAGRIIRTAKRLGITQARVSEIKNGKINRFSLSMLVRLAERAGLRPGIRFQKAA
jgi:DNA-binding Xre family transcriptional regulator